MIIWPENVSLIESKYSRCYDRLIKKAQLRGTITGYKETHHIIPLCMGGKNNKSNLVQLTAREHYISHALLWKMKFEGIHGSKMAYAFNTFINKMVTKVRGVHHTYKISSRMYETFRKHYSQILKEKYARDGANFKGKKHSDESKRVIGEKSRLKEFKRGPENPQWGKKQNISSETRAQRSERLKSMWADPEFKEMMMAKRRVFFETPKGIKQREATSKRTKGVKMDPVIVEKSASKRRGRKGTDLFSEQALKNMREGNLNKIYTPEGKQRQIENSRRVGQRPKSESFKKQVSVWMTGIKRPTKTCDHCGKTCVVANHNRWHGNNCKLKKVTIED
jgi:ribosomal protein S27AE